VDIKVPALAAAGVGKAVFKRVAGEVVRARDVRAVRRRVHGVAPPAGAGRPSPAHESAPAIPRGPLTESQRFKFICRAGIMPTARRQWQQGRASAAKCLLCPEGPEETMLHALLACSAFATERAAMWAELEAEVGAVVASAARDMPADRQLAALLGDAQWGDHALAVDGIVREFLSVQFRRRQQAVPVVAAGGAVCDPAHVACQACHARSGAASMLLCDGCDRGYHMRCLVPALRGVPAGDWFCPGCAAAAAPPLVPARPTAPRRRPSASYASVACRVCARQDGEATMLLCDACDGGFHMRCIGMRGRRPPVGDWFCSSCTRSHTTAAGHTGRGARAHGARA
jgi:hypothetical protein